MPVTPTFPGVYVEEIPSGVRTIVGVPTSITAFIGRAKKGETNKATVINGFGDYERIFGGLSLDSSMSFAARDFFLNGGGQAVIVRLYHASAGDPNANPPVPAPKTNSEISLANGIVLQAASEGSWGNTLRVTLDNKTSKDVAAKLGLTQADLLNLTVTDTAPGGASERFLNLSLKESARRMDRVLENESQLIRWKGTYPNPAPTMPTFDSDGKAYDAVGIKEKAVADAQKALDAAKKEQPPDQNKINAAQQALDTANNDLKTTKGGFYAQDGDALSIADYVFTGAQDEKKGLYALEQLFARGTLFNLLCIPSHTLGGDIETDLVAAATAYCESRRAMLIVDPPSGWNSPAKAVEGFTKDPDEVGAKSRNAAIYFPRLRQSNPLRENQIETFVPCGVVAGNYARTDTQRGVWKAPAGLDAMLNGVPQLSVALTDMENGQLNPLGINCLRSFPVAGRVVWGARTLRGADQLADEYKYVPVRRTALYIEESLYRGLKWVVFEPNDEPLWAQIRLNVGAFMQNLFRQGAFQGQTPREAYFVKCDKETTTQNDINLGIVNIVVGFAPLKPAEFVIIKLQQMAGQIEV